MKRLTETPFLRPPPNACWGAVLPSILARICRLSQKFGLNVPIHVSKMDVPKAFRQVRLEPWRAVSISYVVCKRSFAQQHFNNCGKSLIKRKAGAAAHVNIVRAGNENAAVELPEGGKGSRPLLFRDGRRRLYCCRGDARVGREPADDGDTFWGV